MRKVGPIVPITLNAYHIIVVHVGIDYFAFMNDVQVPFQMPLCFKILIIVL